MKLQWVPDEQTPDATPGKKPKTRSQKFRYAAFVSYSRAVDGKLAPALQHALQQFAKPWYQLRGLRIFRDDASLSANPSLWAAIQNAMDASEFFVLLASPESAKSTWVRREVQHWLAHRETDHLLIAVTGGNIAWDSSIGDFNATLTTCLPPELGGHFAEEPFWVDLRTARREELLSRHAPAFSDLVADLAAPLRHAQKDDLVGADVRQHRRTHRLVRATIAILSALVLLVGIGAFIADQQRRRADDQSRHAQQQQRIATARQLMAQARTTPGRDAQTALRLSLAAYHLHPVPETRLNVFSTLTATEFAGTLSGHTASVTHLSSTPDGQLLASGDDAGTVILWDFSDPTRPQPVSKLQQKPEDEAGPFIAMTLAQDARTLLTVGKYGKLTAWDITDRTHPRRLGLFATGIRSVTSATFTPDGRTMAVAAYKSDFIVLHDLTDPANPIRIGPDFGNNSSPDWISKVELIPNGRTLAVTTIGGAITLWDITNRSQPRRITRLQSRDGQPGWERPMATTSDSRILATTAADRAGGTISLWEISDPARPRPLTDPLPSTFLPSEITFTADSKTLAAGGGDGTVHLWNIAELAGSQRLGKRLVGQTENLAAMAFSQAGKTLVTSGFTDRQNPILALWDLTNPGRPQRLGQLPESASWAGISPDGRLWTTTDHRGGMHRWDVTNPASPRELANFPQALAGEFSPDGHLLASLSGNVSQLNLWDMTDLANPRQVAEITTGHASNGRIMMFDPSGRVLIIASGREVTMWDVTDPARPQPIGQPFDAQPNDIKSMAITRDGQTLAFSGGGVGAGNASAVFFWDIADLTRPQPLDEPLIVPGYDTNNLQFSPDQKTLATYNPGYDGVVLFWNVADLTHPKLIGQPSLGRPGDVKALALSADLRLVAVSNFDTVTFWDITDPSRPQRLEQPSIINTYQPAGVRFVGTRKVVVSGGDPAVSLWDLGRLLDLHALAPAQACEFASGGLSKTQWSTYVSEIPFQNTCPGYPPRSP